jgi:hypothetical protein
MSDFFVSAILSILLLVSARDDLEERAIDLDQEMTLVAR